MRKYAFEFYSKVFSINNLCLCLFQVVTGLSSYDLVCLGVGKGATAVYSNKTSSSFALVRRSTGECILLIDIGLGSIFALQNYLKNVNIKPRQIFVSHNHSDHSGELPVYIANEAVKSIVRVYCFIGIQSRLRQHRCAELDSSTTDLFRNVQWIMCDESQDVELDSGDPKSVLKIRVHQSQHSELCAGFVLYENNQAILSFSGDSGFNTSLYTFLWTAPTILVDGRQTSTYEHASFDEILNFYKTTGAQRQVFVYHYGLENEKPTFPANTISAVSPGEVIQLMLP
jgi:ribonuclease BN (tRNA processing enzyme)